MDTIACDSAWSRIARRYYHQYRDGPVRLGHPLLRRLLQSTLRPQRQARLRNGIWLELDLRIGLQQTLFWLEGDLEPQLSWAIREFLPPHGTFVDCGANCGYFGLEARRIRQARALFIEPHPRLAAAIRTNLALNGWQTSSAVVEAAASDRPGEATLCEAADNDGSHALAGSGTESAPSERTFRVRLCRLDEILDQQPGFETVDFLKVDAEGHDWNVLLGLGDRLRPDRIRLIYTELSQHRPAAVAHMKERGYVGFVTRAFRNGVCARRAAREAERGQAVCFYTRANPCDCTREILWCGRDTAAADRLAALARNLPPTGSAGGPPAVVGGSPTTSPP